MQRELLRVILALLLTGYFFSFFFMVEPAHRIFHEGVLNLWGAESLDALGQLLAPYGFLVFGILALLLFLRKVNFYLGLFLWLVINDLCYTSFFAEGMLVPFLAYLLFYSGGYLLVRKHGTRFCPERFFQTFFCFVLQVMLFLSVFAPFSLFQGMSFMPPMPFQDLLSAPLYSGVSGILLGLFFVPKSRLLAFRFLLFTSFIYIFYWPLEGTALLLLTGVSFNIQWLPPKHGHEKAILFFDGVCHLCNQAVDLMIQESLDDTFKIASLQGETASKLGLKEDEPQSLVVWRPESPPLRRSAAALYMAERMGGMWGLWGGLRFLPEAFLDGLYDGLAKRRYALFGKKETCRLPTEAERKRFLP